MKAKLIEVLKKYRDCFGCDYGKMYGLNRSVVEHLLPIQLGKWPLKQHPRWFAP